MFYDVIRNMDYVWDAFYDVGLTRSPSLASVPIFPKQCQRNLYQYYEVDPEIIGQGSFACIRRVKLRRQQQHVPNNCATGSKGNNGDDDDGDGDDDSGNDKIAAASPSDDAAIHDRSYACKTILKSKLYDRELFLREVYNLNRCQSSNKNNSNNNCVIRLLDVLEDRSSIHIVTELCEGGELFDYIVKEHDRASKGLRGKALSPSSSHGDGISDGDETRCAAIVYQILTAVVFLHEEASVCHRDLKASNFVFVQKPSFVSDTSLTLKVIDFGLSKFVGKCQEESGCRKNGIQEDTNNGVKVPNGRKTDLDSTKSKADGISNNESSSSHQAFSIWGAIKASYFSETPVTHDCSTSDNDEVATEVATNMAESEDDTIPATQASTNATERMDDDECDSCDDERLLYSKYYRYMTSEVGTPYYVAPEVLKQQQREDHQTQSTILSTTPATNDDSHHNNNTSSGYTTKCDIWSIGVLAFFTLTGTLPVLGEDERDTVRKLMDPNLEVDFFDETLWEQQDVVVEGTDNHDHDDTGSSNKQKKPKISNSALMFCKALLQRDPRKRPTAREALRLDWIATHCGNESALASSPSPLASTAITTEEAPHHRQRSPLPSLSRRK